MKLKVESLVKEVVEIVSEVSIPSQDSERIIRDLQGQDVLPALTVDEIKLLEALARATREVDVHKLLASVPS